MSVEPVARSFAPEALGTAVHLRGWVLRSRSSGGIAFLLVRDRTGSVQVTARRDAIGAEGFDKVEHLPGESVVEVEGTVHADARAPGGREVRASAVRLLQVSEPFPIWSDQTEEFRLDHRHLTVRTQEMVAMVRLKAAMLRAFREFFDREEVLETTPPILSGNAAEGGSEAFTLDYFGKPGYLGQTAQLYLEALIAPHERVYALTSSFRAEKSRTPRHLTEYLHLEAELAWCDLEELMQFVERMLRQVLAELARRAPEELRLLGREPSELTSLPEPFPRVTYAEALERLRAKNFDLHWGSDIATAEERALSLEERAPLFLTHFPRELKAFYMLQSPHDERTVEAFDLLAPEGYGELVGASCRETDNTRLRERLVATGVNPEEYGWYLDLRRYGSVPHAGFGLGIERVLRWVTRREHIRDTTPFPRTPARLTP
ncbi:MAG: asparagine--tRNA ligase [Thermoplasmata archaeon]|nr:asparagine--tRNA ligase [Thermoplasmata archaeon]MCI4341716.1 asparagine--tRNA ligase [Thermoplasmata archaeon]